MDDPTAGHSLAQAPPEHEPEAHPAGDGTRIPADDPARTRLADLSTDTLPATEPPPSALAELPTDTIPATSPDLAAEAEAMAVQEDGAPPTPANVLAIVAPRPPGEAGAALAFDDTLEHDGEPLAQRPASTEQAVHIVTALLFVAGHPISLARLSRMAGGTTEESMQELLRDVAAALAPSGLIVQEVAGGYQLATPPSAADWVWRLARRRAKAPISTAALETLAIVAYKQPVTKGEVDIVRGMDSGQHLRHLVDEELLEITGRKEVPGKPLLYGTTRNFLRIFGLPNIAALPSIHELRRLYAERDRERQARDAEAAQERRRMEREEALARLSELADAPPAAPAPDEAP